MVGLIRGDAPPFIMVVIGVAILTGLTAYMLHILKFKALLRRAFIWLNVYYVCSYIVVLGSLVRIIMIGQMEPQAGSSSLLVRTLDFTLLSIVAFAVSSGPTLYLMTRRHAEEFQYPET